MNAFVLFVPSRYKATARWQPSSMWNLPLAVFLITMIGGNSKPDRSEETSLQILSFLSFLRRNLAAIRGNEPFAHFL